MSGKIINTRKRVIQLSLAVLWIVLGIILFVFNRGHTLLVDNRNLEDANLRAPDLITVAVDKSAPLEFFRGDRDLYQVGGGRHRIRIEFSDGNPPFETDFTLPLGPDMFILSVPKMINGIEPYIEVFYTEPEPPSDDEDEEIVFE